MSPAASPTESDRRGCGVAATPVRAALARRDARELAFGSVDPGCRRVAMLSRVAQPDIAALDGQAEDLHFLGPQHAGDHVARPVAEHHLDDGGDVDGGADVPVLPGAVRDDEQ